jgi:hypothetical protein
MEIGSMLKIASRTGFALTLIVACSGMVMAQGDEQTRKSDTAAPLRAKSILGAKVQIQGDTGVGTIEDFVLNEDGVMEYFIVSDNGKLVTVPWDAAKFNFEKRTAVINITQEQYRVIPTYTADRYPEFYTPVYRTQVYKYYGLTPGPVRRLERRLDRR